MVSGQQSVRIASETRSYRGGQGTSGYKSASLAFSSCIWTGFVKSMR